MMLNLACYKKDEWKPPIIETIATKNEGITELLDTIAEHMEYLKSTGALNKRMRDRVEGELKDWIRGESVEIVIDQIKEEGAYESLLDGILKREVDPHTAAIAAIKHLRGEQ